VKKDLHKVQRLDLTWEEAQVAARHSPNRKVSYSGTMHLYGYRAESRTRSRIKYLRM